MEQKLMLYPMFALVGWSFVMAFVMIQRAFRAVGEGLNPEYFRYGKGFKAPGYMQSAYQHYNNLYEMPVLFYAAIVVIYITTAGNAAMLILSWSYVAARVAHSLFHLSNSNVPRRRDAFMLSTMLLMGLWATLFWVVIDAAG